MTYPKSLYYSAKAYGFGYLPGGLYVEPDGWNEEINHWLASLQGLSYERTLPRASGDSDKDWKDFIDRIWRYLKEGAPVQICRGWSRRVREEKGRIYAPSGKRIFWWEGMRKAVRPDMHYVTAVGMDKAKGILYVNDPIAGWFGVKKNLEMDLRWLRRTMEGVPKHSKYITIVFKRTGNPSLSEREIEKLLRVRKAKRIKGDPSVYDKPGTWQEFYGIRMRRPFVYGIKGIEALIGDLEPERFGKILEIKKAKRGILPVEALSWLDLYVYHYSYITLISSEYLEKQGRLKEWEWLFRLHTLYEKLWISTSRLRALFRSEKTPVTAVDKARPILGEMQRTLAQMKGHFERYLKSQEAGDW